MKRLSEHSDSGSDRHPAHLAFFDEIENNRKIEGPSLTKICCYREQPFCEIAPRMKIQRSITEPIRQISQWDEKWNGLDQGLIACWERGRTKSIEDPSLASQARNGQLVMLPWRGGVEKVIKKKQKYGSYSYLAMWQGLRGDDLSIDVKAERSLICTVTKMTVVFTNDRSKFAEAEPE